MEKAIERIIHWLKENGSSSFDGKKIRFVEQHKDFIAEWQDLNGRESLLIGYCRVVNGEVWFDPFFLISFTVDGFERMILNGQTQSDIDISEEMQVQYLNMFYESHMTNRSA